MSKKINKSNVQDVFELNMSQIGMLFHYLKEVKEGLYNVQLTFNIEGAFDVNVFEKALNIVQSSNDVLRSVFRWEEVNKPLQIILKECPIEFTFHDISQNEDIAGFVKTYLLDDQNHRFDLTKLPFRCSVLKTGEKSHVLFMTHHHILYDGWSTGILLKELFACHQQLMKNQRITPLVKPAYKDVHKAIQRKKKVEGSEFFWKNYLKDYETSSLLSEGSSNSKQPIQKLKSTVPDINLEEFAKKYKATKAVVLYAAYGILLQRFSNISDVVFGTTVSGRDVSMPGNEVVIGNFINTIPLRLKDVEDQTLLEVIAQLSDHLIESNDFSHTSYFETKQLLGLSSTEELFDSIFVVENYPLDEKSINGNQGFSIELQSAFENTEIPLIITAFFKKDLEIEFSYKGGINDSYIYSLSKHYTSILNEIVSDCNQTVKSIQLLTDTDRQQLNAFNDTSACYPIEETVISLFDSQVSKNPYKTAFKFGEVSYSYSALKEKSDRIAHYLRTKWDIKEGDLVGIMLEREEYLIPCIYGILKSGGCYVPVDPSHPAERINSIIEDSGMKVLVTRGKHISLGLCGTVTIVDLDESEATINMQEVKEALPRVNSKSLAYVIYTSGSTGKPKGVEIEHHSVVNRLLWMQKLYGLGEEDVILQKTPIVFDVSVWELFWWSFTGASLVLLKPGEEKDSKALTETISREKITTIHFVPPMLHAFLNSVEERSDYVYLSSLRQVFASGEALKSTHVNEFGRILHRYCGTRLINLYGPTEATVDVTFYECSFEQENTLVPIGKPINNTQIYILNKDIQLLPIGVTGELYIGGVGLAKGYINNRELTSERFINSPFASEERLYRTGDLARWLEDGNIEYLGRIDQQVKIRGFRIESGEIEKHLLQYAPVKEAVVLVKEKEDDKHLIAYYMSEKSIETSVLRGFLNNRLPEYMVPSFYIHLTSVPLTSNGKVDRKALLSMAVIASEEFEEASSETEQKLVEIWSDLLSTEKGKISVNRSFFELGGHSLKATSLVNRIFREFEVEILLKEIFNNQDIRSLSRLIEHTVRTAYLPVEKQAVKPYYKVSFAQKQLFFLHQLDKSSLAYNMPQIFHLQGNPDLEKLSKAFKGLIKRHESLRTSFKLVNNELVQEILADASFKLEYYHSLGNEEQIIKDFIRPFDLEVLPLIRVGVIKISSEKHILIVDLHHIIIDGVSQSIIIEDFIGIYNNLELPELTLQYKDYAEWQQSEGKRKQIAGMKDFWLKEFFEESATLELPIDFKRPLVKSTEGDSIDFELSFEETIKLKSIADQEGCTLFMVMLSIYNILLSKISNQEDITIGSPVGGRQHADLDKMVGMFINTLPLRNFPKGDLNFDVFLASLKSKILACFDNQAYPYEQLVEELKVGRDTSRNPLFDVLFLFQNFDEWTISLPNLEIKPDHYKHQVSKFDLTLLVTEAKGQLFLSFEYSTALFKKETIEKFISYFKTIVSSVVSDTSIKISEIEYLSEEEKHELLNEFNNTQANFPSEETLVSLFENQVNLTPDKNAIIYENKHLTFQELNDEANKIAHLLLTEYGTKPNDLMGIMVQRSEKMMIGLLGILKSGAAYIPIDPSYPKERIEYILEDSKTNILIVNKEPEVGFNFRGEIIVLNSERENKGNTINPEYLSNSEDLCYMIYTSGSTGNPKGVMISHRNVINFFSGMNKVLSPKEEDCMLAITSTSFDISVLELFWTLCNGTEVVIQPSDISLDYLDRYVSEEDLSIDFSLFFFSSYTSSTKEKYSLLLEATKYADEAGFKAVWTPERHFHEFGGLYPNPSVLSAALAMITSNIELRSGSVVSPLHDAVRIAEEWSVVDNLSGGRVGLSFASGWNPDDFALSKDNYKVRHKVMYEQIEEVRKLWRGETIKRENGVGKELELRIFPNPVQRELPVWITSAGNPETYKSAGAIGTNILTHFLGQDIEMLAHNISLYKEARKKAGYDPGKVTLMLHTFIGEDIVEVEQTVKEPFVNYLKSSIGLSKVIFEEAGFKEDDLSDELRDKILKNSFERYYKTSSLIGTKSSCIKMLQKLKETGVDEIGCLIDFGIEESKVIEGLRHLKELKNLTSPKNERVHKPVTIMQSTPSFVKILTEDKGSQKFLKSLEKMLIGGEQLPLQLVRKIKEVNGDVEIVNMYGPTETTIWSTTWNFDENRESVSIGKPIQNTQIYILSKHLQLLPKGAVGEMYIGGEGISKGYWNKEELTKEKFIPNPFSKSGRIYNTGDIARWSADGNLEYVGRKDHQVKIRGFRIELGEIESRLRELDQIEEAIAVVKVKNDAQHIVAYYVASQKISLSELRSFLVEKIPEYMIPSFFVKMDEFPLTPNGKIDRKRLPEPEVEENKHVKAPETKEELFLVKIWADVLGSNRINVLDNFFALGGDSIKSIQISARAREAGYDLKVKDIFISQNIEQLALKLKTINTLSNQNAVVGKGKLTPIQSWFYDHVKVERAHYNQSVMLNFPNRIRKDHVLQIFGKILEHHDALRLVFREETGSIVPEYKEIKVSLSVQEADLTDAIDFNNQLISRANKLQSSIDLENGPLINLGLFHQGESSFLLIVIHHLVIDGISWRILFEDIDRFYKQVVNGETFKLPLKTESYQAWSSHLADYVHTSQFESAKKYWDHFITQGADTIKSDWPVEINRVEDQKVVKFKLNKEQTNKLLGQVHWPFNTQINDILLATLFMAVQRKYSNKSLIVDMEGHGREQIHEQVSIARTIGWFTSIYSVRLEDGGTLAGTIKRTKEIFRSIPNNGIDYLLNEYYDVPASSQVSNKTKKQVFFNYLGQFDGDTQNLSFSVSLDSTGDLISPKGVSNYEWEILGLVSDGELQIGLTYSERQYSNTTIAAIMDCYKEILLKTIEYCCSLDTQALTPSDLTYKNVPSTLLESLQSKYEIENIYPLSPMQEGLLFHSVNNSSSNQYFNQIAYEMSGKLNLEVMRSSLDQLIERYEVLRTVFLIDEYDRPLQLVKKNETVCFKFKDIRQVKGKEGALVEIYKREDRKKNFDLRRDSLLRVNVFQTDDDQFQLIWSYHHILMDGWSLGNLLSDFEKIYNTSITGKTVSLPSIQPYSQYIDWLEKRDQSSAIEYWQKYLLSYSSKASLANLNNSFDQENLTGNLESYEMIFDKEQTGLLSSFSKDFGLTVNTIIQGAWGLLLAKYNNTNDVVFGSVVSGRPTEVDGIGDMVGMFMNMIPVRFAYKEDDTVLDILARVQHHSIDSEPFHYLQLSEVQSLSELGSELFDHYIVFENFPIQEEIKKTALGNESDGRVVVGNVEIFEQSNYDFSIIIVPGESLTFKFEFNPKKYERAQIARLVEHYQKIVSTILTSPKSRALDIDILSDSDIISINKINDTHLAYQHDKSLVYLFEEQAARLPDRLAVIGPECSLTFSQLSIRSNQLGNWLRSQGIKKGDSVGLLVDRSVDMIMAIIGILKSGANYLPIALDIPVSRGEYMLQQCQSKLLLCSADNVHLYAHQLPVVALDSSEIATCSKDGLPDYSTSSDLAYCIFTSGSTGLPKGVLMQQRAIINLVAGLEEKIYKHYPNQVLRTALLASLAFDSSIQQIFPSLLLGNTLYMASDEARKDGELLLQFYNDNRIDISEGTPTHLKLLLGAIKPGEYIETLKCWTFAGEVLSKQLVQQLFSGICKQDSFKVFNIYGPTETCVDSTCFEVEPSLLNKYSFIPIGKPLPNERVYIIDGSGKLVPPGVIGELCIGGDGLAVGYLGDKEKTEEKFVAGLVEGESRIYKTGDLARLLPDGNLQYIGRSDSQVKLRGIRVEPGEIAHHIEEYKMISKAIVNYLEDGENKYLAAYYVSDKPYTASDIIAYLEGKLPRYIIPSYFIHIDRVPLTISGKVDLKALPKPQVDESKYNAPSNELEEGLVNLWSLALKTHKDLISVDTSFFELGGHSLNAAFLARKIYHEFGLKIKLSDIFKYPTVKELACFIQEGEGQVIRRISISEEKEYYPLSSAQLSVYMAMLLNDTGAYNIPFVIKVDKKYSLNKIEEVFKELIQRHDSLRTSFKLVNNFLHQVIHKKVDFNITEQEIGGNQPIKLVEDFDLETAPLMKVVNLKTSANKDSHCLLVDIHHLISDGESLNLLRLEFNKLLRHEELDRVEIQYKDFIEWQRQHRETQNFIFQKEFWKNEMALLNLTQFPTDFPKKTHGKGVCAVFRFEIKTENIGRVQDFLLKRKISLSIYLLSIYKIIIHKYSQSEDIIVGFTTSGRTLSELEGLFGLLANIVPIRTFPSAGKKYIHYLEELRQKYNEVFANQDLQLSEIISLVQNGLQLPTIISTVFTLNTDYNSKNGSDEFEQNFGLDEADIDLNIAPKWDIFIDAMETDDSIAIDINYDSELFTLDSIKAIAQHFNEIIDQTLSELEIKIEDIALNDTMEVDDKVRAKFQETEFNFN